MFRRITILIFALSMLMLFMSARAQTSQPQVTQDQVQAALPELEKFIQDAQMKTGVPGVSVAIVYQDKVMYLKGFGVREVGKTDAVNEDTVFQIASLSKPVGSTVVAALVGEGVVAWDSKISDLDPSFALFEPYPTSQVTIQDLYSHRSGLPGNAGNELESIGFTRAEILHRLRYMPPASSFRSAYSYSNFGMTAGGVAAAKPTGKSWEEVSKEKLYAPLGMTHTTSVHAEFLQETNVAKLHTKPEGKWEALVTREPDAQSPAGGVSSTARDMAQWLKLVIGNGKFDGKQLIQADALRASHQPVIHSSTNVNTGLPNFYGMGWNLTYDAAGRAIWAHAGAFSVGARTVVTVYPNDQLGIVVLSNAFPTGLPEAVSATFFDLVHDGKPQKDYLTIWENLFGSFFGSAIEQAIQTYAKPPSPLFPAQPDAAYVGTYANDYLGAAHLVKGKEGLVLQVGPTKMEIPLKHWNRDVFLAYMTPEIPNYPNLVSFTIGAEGKALEMLVEALDTNGQGLLPRVDAPEPAANSQNDAASAANGDFAGLVNIGNGREMYLECRGTGSPPVILEAGYRNTAGIWSLQGAPNRTMVFPGVAEFTRVCAYDRPGTILDEKTFSRSTPVKMPRSMSAARTAQDVVADLHTLLEVAKVPGPYVLVGHSFGGLFTRLYASTYPDQVVGLVLVDALSEQVRAKLTPEQWTLYKNFGFVQPPPGITYPALELNDVDASFDQMKNAKPLHPIPLIVISKKLPFDLTAWAPLPADFQQALNTAWEKAQAGLKQLVPNARHYLATQSAHYVQVQEPELVIWAIEQIVKGK